MNNSAKWILLAMHFLCGLLIGGMPIKLQGQNNQYSFQQLTVEDGLTLQSDNYYIFQDSRKMMWISSTQGVNLYNGHSIVSRIEDFNIQSNFFEDVNENVWFSSYEAILEYDRATDSFDSLRIKNREEAWINMSYKLLGYDAKEHCLWVQITDKGELYKYDIEEENSTFILTGVDSLNSEITKTTGEAQSLLLNPLAFGLQITGLSDFKCDTILDDYNIRAYHVDKDRVLWAACGEGFVRYDLQDSIVKFWEIEENLMQAVNGIVDAGDSTLILSIPNSGLYIFNKRTGEISDQIYSYHNGLLTPFINSFKKVYLDRDRNLWITTDGNGIYFINLDKPKIDRYIINRTGLVDKNNRVRAITEDSKKLLYCLTGNNVEVINLENGSVFQIDRPASLSPGRSSFYILSDRDDNIWYASNGGLFVSLEGQNRFKKVRDGSYHYLHELSDSTLLLSSPRGMLKMNRKNYSTEELKFSSVDTVSYALSYLDPDNRCFLFRGPKEILALAIDEDSIRVLDTISVKGLIHGIIADTSQKDLWWVASSQGLWKMQLSADSFTYQRDSIFPVNFVAGIVQDSLGRIWLSTNKGLYQYTPDSNPDSAKIHLYSIADGLQSLEFAFWSAMETSNNRIAFGGVNGLNLFNPYTIEPLKIKPNPSIVYIEINKTPFPDFIFASDTSVTNIAEKNNLVLEHDQNDLYLEIAPMEYSDPNSIQYTIELILRGDTVFSSRDNTFHYPNLETGKYKLHYAATNSDGKSLIQKELEITVKPPWWKTWWAFLLYIFGIAAIVYYYYRYRVALIKKEEAHKRAIAEYKQLTAETETAILRLQMNPHFIFNSLNSISSYIANRDIETANDYLSRFARLMRMILKYAAKPMILVSDEIDLLEQYLQTEAMRFEKKFSYSFLLEDDFDPEDYKIPTMILHPFIENAIWHGLANLQREGKIIIRFWEENACLHCSIEDNGIGRAAAAQKTSRDPDYESKALSITAKRLELLKARNGVRASMQIQDVLDHQQQTVGTLVQLQFPL